MKFNTYNLILLGIFVASTYGGETKKDSREIYPMRFESSRTSASQESAIGHRAKARISRKEESSSARGASSSRGNTKFSRNEESSQTPSRSRVLKTNPKRSGLNLRRRISDTENVDSNKSDTSHVWKEVPKSISTTEKDSPHISKEIEEISYDSSRIDNNEDGNPLASKKDSEKKSNKQPKRSDLRKVQGRSSVPQRYGKVKLINEAELKKTGLANRTSQQDTTESKNLSSRNKNLETASQSPKSSPNENMQHDTNISNRNPPLVENNKKRRRKVLRIRNRHKNNNTPKTMEEKIISDKKVENSETSHSPPSSVIKIENAPISRGYKQENNTFVHEKDQFSETGNTQAIKESMKDSLIDSMKNSENPSTEKHSRKEFEANFNPLHDSTQNAEKADKGKPKTIFRDDEESNTRKFSDNHEYSNQNFNRDSIPEKIPEGNDQYMVSYNYMGNKDDQPKDVIKLSEYSVSKKGVIKKAQAIPEKKVQPKSEKRKIKSHRTRNFENERGNQPERLEFSKRFTPLLSNEDKFAQIDHTDEDIVENYEINRSPVTYKKKNTKKSDEAVWVPAKLEKYSVNEDIPISKQKTQSETLKTDLGDTFFHSYNSRNPYPSKNNLATEKDFPVFVQNNESPKKASERNFKKPFNNRSVPAKKQSISSSENKGKYFMHMFKRVGDVSLENFDASSSEVPRNDGFMSSLKLSWNDDDRRAHVETSIDSRMQPSTFKAGSSIFQSSFEDNLGSELSVQRQFPRIPNISQMRTALYSPNQHTRSNPQRKSDNRRAYLEDKPYYLKPDIKNFKDIYLRKPDSRTDIRFINPEVRSYYLKPENEKEIKRLTNDFHNQQLHFPFEAYRRPNQGDGYPKPFQMQQTPKKIQVKSPSLGVYYSDSKEQYNARSNSFKMIPVANNNNYKIDTHLSYKMPSETQIIPSTIKLTQNPSEDMIRNKMRSENSDAKQKLSANENTDTRPKVSANENTDTRPKGSVNENLPLNKNSDSKTALKTNSNRTEQIRGTPKFQRRAGPLNTQNAPQPFIKDNAKATEKEIQLSNASDLQKSQNKNIKVEPDQDVVKHAESQHFQRISKDSFDDFPLPELQNAGRETSRSIEPHAWEYGFEQPAINSPRFNSIPKTSFDCKGKYGYHADPETGCQVFHMCQGRGAKHSFLCPNNTIFNQQLLVCDWHNRVNCDGSTARSRVNDHLYSRNANSDSIKKSHNDAGRQWKWATQQARTNNYGSFKRRKANSDRIDTSEGQILKETPDGLHYLDENDKARRNHRNNARPPNYVSHKLQGSGDEPKTSISLPNGLPNNPPSVQNINKDTRKKIQEHSNVSDQKPQYHNNFQSEKIVEEHDFSDNRTNSPEFQNYKKNEYFIHHDQAKPENHHKEVAPIIYEYDERNNKDNLNRPKVQDLRIKPKRQPFSKKGNTETTKIPLTEKPRYYQERTNFATTSTPLRDYATTFLAEEFRTEPPRSTTNPYSVVKKQNIVPFTNIPVPNKLEGDIVNTNTIQKPVSALHSDLITDPVLGDIQKVPDYKPAVSLPENHKSSLDPKMLVYTYPLEPITKKTGESKQSNYGERIVNTNHGNARTTLKSQQGSPRNAKVPKSQKYIDVERKNLPNINVTSRIADIVSRLQTIGTGVSQILDGKDNLYKSINIHKLKPAAPSQKDQKINFDPFAIVKFPNTIDDSKSVRTDIPVELPNISQNRNKEKSIPTSAKNVELNGISENLNNTNEPRTTTFNPIISKNDSMSNSELQMPYQNSQRNPGTHLKNQFHKVIRLPANAAIQQSYRQKDGVNLHVQSRTPVDISPQTKYDQHPTHPIVKQNGNNFREIDSRRKHLSNIPRRPITLNFNRDQHTFTNAEDYVPSSTSINDVNGDNFRTENSFTAIVRHTTPLPSINNLNGNNFQNDRNVHAFPNNVLQQPVISKFNHEQHTLINAEHNKPSSTVINYPNANSFQKEHSYSGIVRHTTPLPRKNNVLNRNNFQNDRNVHVRPNNVFQKPPIPNFNRDQHTVIEPVYRFPPSQNNAKLNENNFKEAIGRPKYNSNIPQGATPKPNMLQHTVTESLNHAKPTQLIKNSINKKYFQGIRGRHTYNTVPQRDIGSNTHVSKMVPHNKPSFTQNNLPAFIFTVNPSQENPNWKTGQKYNPSTISKSPSISLPQNKPSIEHKQEILSRKPFDDNNDDPDCDDSSDETETSDHLSLGKYGPNYKTIQNFPKYNIRPTVPSLHTNGRVVTTSNDDEESKETGPHNCNNKGKQPPPDYGISINEKRNPSDITTPINHKHFPIQNGFSKPQSLPNYPKITQDRKYKPKTRNVVKEKEQVAIKPMKFFHSQFSSPALTKKYEGKKSLLDNKHSMESGVSLENSNKLRNVRSSEESSEASKDSHEDSASTESKRKAEYRELERAAELEAEKMVKSTTKST
ncbi:U-scoloptoxin(01)-Er1a like protein [Argiope bruennichi]|uniref:U-scoloptoxin(01)-Er1a like protein n=1 Tax=Argiope bruennichi TaxID=94029 RepID=A0A8T0E0R8_ARGBR|nr:U-scoloptoxin(01)-Er1a like protein [Argiope bruennichi]